ncbi:MAG: histidine--tRNA ligase [Patescibacteria group bacterium]
MPRPKKNATKDNAVKKPEKKAQSSGRILGMKDTLPSDWRYFKAVSDRAYELAEYFGFNYLKTPLLESYDLYKKSSRRPIDKELYWVEGEKAEKIVLRPEITQGIIRAYLENINQFTLPLKIFSMGPIFRQEKLQSGRYRESNQLDLEIIGDNKPMAEVGLIALANNFFKELKINVQVQVNSLGGPECRKEYNTRLLNFYKERGRRSKLCNACKKNLGKNSLTLLDCKEDACAKMKEEAPQIADYLNEASRDHFKKALEHLDELGINYNFNPYLVRGLSYYNDTVFEFWPVSEDGVAQSKLALAGGGRFDTLIESFGGPATPAAGLAIGLERTVIKAKDNRDLFYVPADDIIFIGQLGEQAKIKSLLLFEDLRKAGFNVRHSFCSDSLKNQMEEATNMKAKLSLILGKKEVMDETIIMRDMDSAVQEVVPYKKIKDKLEKKINRKRGVLYG